MKTATPACRTMTWSEFFDDLRAIFQDESLRTWCALGFAVIIQSLFALFVGDFVWGMIFAWTLLIFLQMLFGKR
jgi:hypothetical protein